MYINNVIVFDCMHLSELKKTNHKNIIFIFSKNYYYNNYNFYFKFDFLNNYYLYEKYDNYLNIKHEKMLELIIN